MKKRKYQRALVSAEKSLSSRRNRQLLETFIRESGLVGEFRRYLVRRQLKGDTKPPTTEDKRYLLIFTDFEDNFWYEWYQAPNIEEAIDTADFLGQGKVENLALDPVQTERLKRFLQ